MSVSCSREIPQSQRQPVRPSLREIFASGHDPLERVAQAYQQHRYRLYEIAAHLGVHYATVSRRFRQWEVRRRDGASRADQAAAERPMVSVGSGGENGEDLLGGNRELVPISIDR